MQKKENKLCIRFFSAEICGSLRQKKFDQQWTNGCLIFKSAFGKKFGITKLYITAMCTMCMMSANSKLLPTT